ncbi:hypothetical protein A8F94_15950 [Bacillus sp. FJAT-27225]|nr:hypothetical protein A8F94_15950 [Bacillus sp. FJAT-27225]
MNTRGCTVTKIVPEKTLQFTWKGPDPFNSLMNRGHELTEVKVSLDAVGPTETKVSIEHSGFNRSKEWDEAFNWHQNAWTGVLSSLKSAIETGEGELCCQPNL